MKLYRPTLYLPLILLAFAGCKKEHRNEPENIDLVQLHFIPNTWSGGDRDDKIFTFHKPGSTAGGVTPVNTPVTLFAGTSYTVHVLFFSKNGNGYTEITDEINRESSAHRVYVDTGTVNSPLTVLSTNIDKDQKFFGSSGWWILNKVAEREIKVILRHYAGNPSGKENSDPVNSPKSVTDIEATFLVRPF